VGTYSRANSKEPNVIYDPLVAGALIAILTVAGAETTTSRVGLAHSSAAQDTTFASQKSEGEVTLELEPRWRDGEFVIEVEATTHSVDLGAVNLLEQTRLFIGERELTPTEAGSLTGHHATATILFTLEARPTTFTIEIRDVPDQPVRRLTWAPS
jgi:hypothetical protein